MPPLSLLFKKAPTSTKLSMLSLFLLAASAIPTQIANYQQRQQQQAISAAIAKRNAAIKQLSSEMDRTTREIKRLSASGKYTDADIKRFQALSRQYEARMEKIRSQPPL